MFTVHLSEISHIRVIQPAPFKENVWSHPHLQQKYIIGYNVARQFLSDQMVNNNYQSGNVSDTGSLSVFTQNRFWHQMASYVFSKFRVTLAIRLIFGLVSPIFSSYERTILKDRLATCCALFGFQVISVQSTGPLTILVIRISL